MNTRFRNGPQEDSNRTEARLDHICESDARHRLRITDDPKPRSFFGRMRRYSPLKSLRRWIGSGKAASA
jgi:hypothetical protein